MWFARVIQRSIQHIDESGRVLCPVEVAMEEETTVYLMSAKPGFKLNYVFSRYRAGWSSATRST